VFVCKRNLISSWFSSEVHPDILSGIDETAAYLASQGASIRHDLEEQSELADMFSMTNAFQVWGCLMSYHKHKPFAEGKLVCLACCTLLMVAILMELPLTIIPNPITLCLLIAAF
jgi:hypothetical protein